VDPRVAGSRVTGAGGRLIVLAPAIACGHSDLRPDSHPVALCASQFEQQPVVLVIRNVMKQLRGAAQLGYDQIDAAIVIEIAIRQTAMGRGAHKIRSGGGAYVFEPPVSQIAEDRVRLRVMKMPGHGVDVVHDVAAGHEQVLPAVVIQIGGAIRPAGHFPRQAGEPASLYASREVILAGGAFNTPQLLMLSGIGPREELERHGIAVRADLPGVGRNLQDRYEIGVVNRMKFKAWDAYKGARFTTDDPQYREWKAGQSGIYSTNGSVLTLFRRSPVADEVPDLFCMSVLSRFSGYYPDYSRDLVEKLNYLTWVVLKAHSRNRTGELTLRSSDPRDMPHINFNYFGEGGEEDLSAVVDGIRFVRRLSARLKNEGMIEAEELPGEHVETDQDLKDFIRTHAWGHHASCTCAIGPLEQRGVLSSDFRVHKTKGLRVVDASVFPRIPGFFIACSVYMIGEKAADVILAQCKQ